EDSNLVVLESTVQLLFAVARADGRVSAHERTAIKEYLRERFGNDRALLNRAESLCAHYECGTIDLEECLRKIKDHFTLAQRAELINYARRVSGKENSPGFCRVQEVAQRLA